MGSRSYLLPLSLIFSAMSGLLSLLPYVFIWLIARVLFSFKVEIDYQLVVRYSLGGYDPRQSPLLLHLGYAGASGCLPCGGQYAASCHALTDEYAYGLLRGEEWGAHAQGHR